MNTNSVNSKYDGAITAILGGGGKTGRRVAAALVEAGKATRVLSRSTSPAFDFNDQSSWEPALRGVSSAYIAFSPDLAIPGATEVIAELVQQAIKSKLSRLVLLSGRGEPEAQKCEQIVQNSGLEWTVVRASWFNQNFSEGEFLSMIQQGLITLPANGVVEPFVDVQDIADVAVAALTEDGHHGQVYEVTGPRLLSFDDVAAEISKAANRPVEFMAIPKEAFLSAAKEAGESDQMLWLFEYLFDTLLDGRNAFVADGVHRALGRAPRDFSEFADEIARTNLWRQVA